jgi:hypothetical protein
VADADLSEDGLVELLRRTTDEPGWLQPLLADVDSRTVLLAVVRMFARAGRTVRHNADALSIGASSGGQPGTALLTLQRASGGTSGVVPQGYPFQAKNGAVARSQVDVPVASGATSVSVPVQTDRQTELVNTEDDPLFAILTGSPIQLDGAGATVLVAAPGTAGAVATTFTQVVASDPIQGGAADWLSEHGNERGLPRQPFEAEADYRRRIRDIPDVATPIAVADVVQSAVQRLGLPACLVLEPFADGADPSIKALHGLSNFEPYALDGDDYLDDPLGGRLLVDRRTITAYFEIRAQDLFRDSSPFLFYLDDGYLDDPVGGFMDAPSDMAPTEIAAVLTMIWDVQAKKPIGVNFDFLLKDPDVFVFHGSSSTAGPVTVWTATPAAGTIWYVLAVEAGHDSPNPVVNANHSLTFTYEDGTTFTTAGYLGNDTQHIGQQPKRVTQVVGTVVSDGVTAVNLVGAFFVNALVL